MLNARHSKSTVSSVWMGAGARKAKRRGGPPHRRHCAQLTNTLWEKRRILVTSIHTEGKDDGIRVTPNVYTTLAEVDRFCDVVKEMVTQGVMPG